MERTPPHPAPADAAAWDEADALARFTRRVPSAGTALVASTFVVEGMTCAACAADVERALRQVDGVVAADVVGATGRARVRWQPQRTSASTLVSAIRAAGHGVRPALGHVAEDRRRHERRLALWRLFVAGFCMMQIMMVATPAYVAAPGELAADVDALLRWAGWLLAVPVLLFSAGPWLLGAWRDLRARRVGMDVPVALGVVVTFVASSGATFAPGGAFGREVYFDSLAMFVFFLLAGRWLELRSRHATLGALDALVERVPERVERLLDDGRSEAVPATSLRAGDRVRVRPGQAFPADGCLDEGSTQVDEALLSGESLPLARRAGDAVLAGSINLSSPVAVRVERTGEDTRYAAIVALVERAALDRPPLVQAADRVARPFLWGVLLLAAAGAAMWASVDPSTSVRVAVAVLVVTCPCALSLAAPSALLAAAGSLARRGVLVQRLGAIEALARADVFAFDKTGTLTEDRLALAEVRWCAEGAMGRPMPQVVALAAASLHPVARALRQAGRGVAAAPLRSLVEHPGQGVEGVDADGRRWRMGSAAFTGAPAGAAPLRGTTAWLSVDGLAVACFGFEQAVRAGAGPALAALRDDGAQTWMLSGDRPDAADDVARALGIGRVHASATPEDKLALVAALQGQGRRVAMVGDGINDAPVLSRADVSVAMGQGAALARAHADFTLLSGRPDDLVAARRLAKRTLSVIRQNLAWAAVYNLACVPLALAGWLPPWAAGLGMAASSLWVVVNAQRLRRPASP
ncbi:heavy metal translocating P-type ATPase [Aquabacterium sp. J223]|uniref:heavy metal translocating P-type ATPase n=1 Tax=Aquabacterium sp. J223 TaxID=2898431 RepID=UPI0021ADE8F8|nr:cation-translocating P-type ATPase [Aquabacterium sp. J223]UUX95032.1 cadmium-translocating P-type ATPase [Aquabacterium sp. J223]